MTKAKVAVVKGFTGQLSGDKAKEQWFSDLRSELKVDLPIAGETKELSLPQERLDGPFLSCLDGAGSLVLDGKKVSKMKVYSGEIELPKKYELCFVMVRTSDASCRLKATITTKK
jgi:hypothetical protein